jgi:hypothetical protein
MVKHAEDERAISRRNLGVSRELQQNRTGEPDPSNGGSLGYPEWFRMDQLARADAGQDIRVFQRFIVRWRERLQRFRVTGNTQKEVLCGMDQMLLSICLFAYPEAQADEIAMFIYEQGDGGVYSRSQISTRMKELQFSRKAASTEGGIYVILPGRHPTKSTQGGTLLVRATSFGCIPSVSATTD